MRKVICMIVLMMGLTFGSTAIANQFTPTKVGNIRSGPGIEYSVIGHTIAYQQWKVLEVENDWVKVGNNLYIHKSLGEKNEESKTLIILKSDENKSISIKEKEGETLMTFVTFVNQLDSTVGLGIIIFFISYFIYRIIIKRYDYNERIPKKIKELTHDHKIEEESLINQCKIDVAAANNKVKMAVDQKEQHKIAYKDMATRLESIYKNEVSSHTKTRDENIKILETVNTLVEAIGSKPLIQRVININKEEDITELKNIVK